MMWFIRGCSVLAFFVVSSVSIAQPQQPRPRPAIDAILTAFDRHSIVFLGEVHWNRQQHRFIQKLLHDERLPGLVNDIAVEFGNSLYQPLIDRYVAGEQVPLDSLRLIWRNTTQVLAWDRPIYADIYVTVRVINKRLPLSRRIRVVALDPPIEWQSIHTAAEFPRLWGYRDPVWFETIEREVLSRNRRVLVISGALHILTSDPPDFKPRGFDRVGLGDAIAQRYPAAAYRIYPATGGSSLTELVRTWPEQSLAEVKGTSLGARSAQLLWPGSVTMFRTVNGKRVPFTLGEGDFPSVEALVDAVLYYGKDSTSAPLPSPAYWDCHYVAELRRRNQLLMPVFGQNQGSLIDSLASQAHVKARRQGRAPCASETR